MLNWKWKKKKHRKTKLMLCERCLINIWFHSFQTGAEPNPFQKTKPLIIHFNSIETTNKKNQSIYQWMNEWMLWITLQLPWIVDSGHDSPNKWNAKKRLSNYKARKRWRKTKFQLTNKTVNSHPMEVGISFLWKSPN